MLDAIRLITEQLGGIEDEKRELMKTMHKDHHSVKDVQEAIQELDHRQKTSTHKSATDEEKIIKELEMLKRSLPKAKLFSGLKPKADKLYAEKKAKLEEVKGVRTIVDAQNLEIEKLRAEMEVIKEQ